AAPAVLALKNWREPSLMSCALPPVALLANWVSEKGLVVIVALPAVALSVNESVKPPVLLRMTEFPAELALVNVIAPLLVKLGAAAVHDSCAIDFEERHIDGEGIRRRGGGELNRADRCDGV